MRTQGDLGALASRQEAALQDCDGKRLGLVEIIDAANAVTHPKPWWRFDR